MNWPAYDSYRDTEEQWLARVPAHWELRPLGFHFTERKTTVSDTDYPPLSVTMGGIVPQLDTAAKTDNPENRKLVLTGDFVINSRSDRKGSSGISDRDGSVSVISTVLEPRGIESRFVHHLLRSVAFQEEYYRFGSGIVADLWSTRYSAMKQITLAVPTVEEQRSIANFLDRETAKIDALIGKQEQLIATLREDRVATITQAVTKGLDPSVEMKNSGIDFVGEIPEHWDLRALKRLVTRVDQGVSPQASAELADDGWGVLKSGCVNGGVFRDTEHKKLPADFEIDDDITVRPGDLLVCRASGSANLVGSAAIVRSLRYQLILSDKTFRIIANQLCMPDYLEWAMNARPYREQVLGAISGAEGLANNLPMSSLRRFLFAVPPFSEQKEIVAHLDNRCAKVDALIDKAAAMIGTLREYRSALITDAVTGKIDVRGVA